MAKLKFYPKVERSIIDTVSKEIFSNANLFEFSNLAVDGINIPDDVPMVPPYEKMWCEWEIDEMAFGAFIVSERTDDGGWNLTITHFVDTGDSKRKPDVNTSGLRTTVQLNSQGLLIASQVDVPTQEEQKYFSKHYIDDCFITFNEKIMFDLTDEVDEYISESGIQADQAAMSYRIKAAA